MKTFLITWSIYPAYGDLSGYELTEAETETEAIAKVETQMQRLTRQGKFQAKAEDVSHLWTLIEPILSLSSDDRRKMAGIFQAINR